MTWPSTFAPGTLGYMQDRIGDELARSDLSTQIAACITDAITIYQKKRFRFSDNFFFFNTVIGQEFYTGTATDAATALANYLTNCANNGTTPLAGVNAALDNANIASLYTIDYLVLQLGTARFDVDKREPEEIELLTQSGSQQGQPQVYAYFQQMIRLYPVPNAVYPMILAGNTLVAAPTSQSATGNPWMLDAERLIRSRAKFEIAANYTGDDELAGRMQALASEAYIELKSETNILTGTGRIVPTQF